MRGGINPGHITNLSQGYSADFNLCNQPDMCVFGLREQAVHPRTGRIYKLHTKKPQVLTVLNEKPSFCDMTMMTTI